MPDLTLQGEFVLPKKSVEPAKQPDALNQTNAPKAPKQSVDKTGTNTHERKNMHFFSSLGYYPSNVIFQNQEADEEVVLVVRRDLITNVPWVLSMIILLILPVVLAPLSPVFFPNLSVSPILVTVTLAFYYLIVFSFSLLYFAIWYFNAGIITNKRVIDLDVPNILVRHLAEARLVSIVDVAFSQVGGIRSFFDYGNVDLQTEGLQQNIEFDRAPDPNFIRKVIGELLVDKPSS